MKKKFIVLISLAFILISLAGVFAVVQVQSSKLACKRVEFYYNPSCPHCQNVFPLIKEYSNKYTDWKFYSFDASQKSYLDVYAVPTVKVYPADNRKIILTGEDEIEKYLKCELEEKSSLECPTHLNLVRGSYFINE